jgi:hypothetical protein
MGRSGSTSSTNSRSRSDEKARGRTSKSAKRDKKKDGRRRRAGRGPGTPNTASDDEKPAAASSSTLAVASSPLALPTDNSIISVDFMNSLASSINSLTTTMQEVQIGMKAIQRESHEQRSQIAAIVGELQGMRAMVQANNSRYESDMANLNQDINHKLEQMKAASASLGAAVPLLSARSSTSAAASAGPSASAASFSTTTGSRPLHRPHRLWFKGFGEVLTTKALNTFTSAAVARLPEEHRNLAKSGCPGFGAVAYVDFPPSASISTIKQHLVDMKLQHTIENGEVKFIRITNDVPIPVRYTSKILGELWQNVKDHVAKLEASERPDPLQLSNSNGKLYLIRGSRPLLLFETHPDKDGTIVVSPKTDNLAILKITSKLTDAWILDATKAAARLAPR